MHAFPDITQAGNAVLQKHTETTARQNGQRERPGRVGQGEGMRS